jgi:hypothetical protein
VKKIILAVAITVVASLAVVASASADVPRYQTQTGTLTVQLDVHPFPHTFNVDVNPCDGSFTGTGVSAQGLQVTETIKGSLIDDQLSFEATYTGDAAAAYPGYKWGTTSAGALGASIPGWDTLNTHFHVTASLGDLTNSSNYKNHGQYVKAMGGGADAAQSCIGMPITEAPFQWSALGSIDSSVMAGMNVALPKAGTYRIDVNGAWTNGSNGNVDAEYTSVDSWATHADGYDIAPFLVGAGFGDVQVNGGFVGWGAYSDTHAYSYLATGLSGTVNLAVFDGDSTTNTKDAGWYGDNSGSLNYTITYVGP